MWLVAVIQGFFVVGVGGGGVDRDGGGEIHIGLNKNHIASFQTRSSKSKLLLESKQPVWATRGFVCVGHLFMNSDLR